MRITIRPEDIQREVFRGSGPGGQHKNKVATCVRLTHLPTGIKAEGRSERSQTQNQQACLKLLIAKLYRHYEEIAKAESDAAYASKPRITFGSQIRTYRLCGQQSVIDHRTGVEDDPKRVLNGNLDKFITVVR